MSPAISAHIASVERLAQTRREDPDFAIVLEQAAETCADRVWAYCNRLDGPRFAEWLKPLGAERLDHSLAVNVRRWRTGGSASIWTADRVLTALGCHFNHVPEELWIGAKG